MNEQRNDRSQPPSRVPLPPATPVLCVWLSGNVFTPENFTAERTPSIMPWTHTYPHLCFLTAEATESREASEGGIYFGPKQKSG